jgi:hypothetical protein
VPAALLASQILGAGGLLSQMPRPASKQPQPAGPAGGSHAGPSDFAHRMASCGHGHGDGHGSSGGEGLTSDSDSGSDGGRAAAWTSGQKRGFGPPQAGAGPGAGGQHPGWDAEDSDPLLELAAEIELASLEAEAERQRQQDGHDKQQHSGSSGGGEERHDGAARGAASDDGMPHSSKGDDSDGMGTPRAPTGEELGARTARF